MALSLRNPVAREWVAHQREKVRPWSEFLDFSSFRKPESPQELKRIFLKNIEVYHANYMVLTTLLLVYAIVTSPLLLIAISVFFVMMNLIEQKGQKVLGRDLPIHQQFALSSVISGPLFFLASAGHALFWTLGASSFVIAIHALSRYQEPEPTPPTETV